MWRLCILFGQQTTRQLPPAFAKGDVVGFKLWGAKAALAIVEIGRWCRPPVEPQVLIHGRINGTDMIKHRSSTLLYSTYWG